MQCCPECLNINFKYDFIHAETYCTQCGIIVQSPPCTDHIDAETIKISKKSMKIWIHIIYLLFKSSEL